ncbi:hypothetical protein SAZ10_09260 [Mesorhizobium sp. BAC0120]|uniref:hypothetical protein n=1 Tax=Mesorhizobium sp. BAC0120 TaxID=3090670 RepID=UPI00298CF7E4|nr:hypothetical protein [Mesorhizobium sp. BAC0120]MDW6021949.1 hypothetical protein [Mesorhizobium sp. BAC0120]
MVASQLELLYAMLACGKEAMMAGDTARSATIVGLNHDLRRKRSFVLLEWDDDAEKHLSLPVPFGCSLENLPGEAEKAVREVSAETAALKIHAAD